MIIPTFFVQEIFTRTTDTGGTLIRFHRYFCVMIFSETLPQQISTSLLLLFLPFSEYRTSIAAAITPESTRIPTNTSSGVLSPVFGLDAVFTLCDTAVVLPPGLPCTVVALLSAVVGFVVGIRVMTGIAAGFFAISLVFTN